MPAESPRAPIEEPRRAASPERPHEQTRGEARTASRPPTDDADRRADASPRDPSADRSAGWTRIPAWSIAHPVGTSMLMLIGAVLGLLFFTRLRVDLLPQIVYPQIRATVTSDGVDPELLEQTVTRQLETGLAATENATKITSTTREGNASVLLEFAYGADIDVALADASANLDRVRATLPEEADPPTVFKADPSEIPVLELAVTSDALDLVTLRRFADRTLRDRLVTTAGVASVDVVGGRERALVVTLDPGRLRGLGLTVRDVTGAIAAANRDEPGGPVTTGQREVLARTTARVQSAEELANLPIPLPGSGAAVGAGAGTAGESAGAAAGEGGNASPAPAPPRAGPTGDVTALLTRPSAGPRVLGDQRTVRLGDLARVEDASEEQRLFVRLNGAPAVKLSIQKQPAANTVEVVDAVNARLAELRVEGAIPGNVKVGPVNDQSVYIRDAIAGVTSATVVGGLLGIVAIALFLTSWRQTLVLVVALPVVVLLTLLQMGAGGLTLNLFSLGGLALGLGQAIDSTIVMLENVTRRLREHATARAKAGPEGGDAAPGASPAGTSDAGDARAAVAPLEREEALAVASAASRDVTGSIVTGTAANLVSVLPFLLVSGLAALLFRELILVITFATLAAVVVSLTLVPTVAVRLVRRELAHEARRAEADARDAEPARPGDAPGARGGAGGVRARLAAGTRRVATAMRGANERLAAWYAGRLEASLRHRRAVVLGAVGVFGATLFLARGLGSEFVPELDDGRVRVQLTFAPGVAIERADAGTQAIERLIGRMPAVATQFATAGGAIYGRNAVQNATRSSIDVQLVAPDARELTTDEWIARLRRELSQTPIAGARVLARKSGVRGLRTSSRTGEIEFVLAGDDFATLLDLGEQLRDAARTVPGLTGVELTPQGGRPEYRIEMDRARAAALGVAASDVGTTVRAALGGVPAGTFVQGDEEYDLRVRMDRRAVANAADLEALPLVGRGGTPLTVGAVARVVEGTGPVEIEREQQRRVVRLEGDANGTDRSLGEVVAEAERRLREAVPLPEGYTLAVGGEAEQQRENQQQLLLVGAVAVFLVFAVMALQYESLLNPLVILLTVPLALTGVVLGLKVSSTPLSAPVLLGVILLAGIVVNNAIILIEYAEEGQRERGLSREAAIVEAGRLRLRPILMTVLTAILGSLPLALGLGKGDELLRPLAIAFVGGLGVATLLTLLVIPSLYLLAHAARERAAGWVHARRRGRPDGTLGEPTPGAPR